MSKQKYYYSPAVESPPVQRHPSLICRALNHEGEPVVVNNEVIKDKLILSCHPRHFYRAPVVIDSPTPPQYTTVPPAQSVSYVPQPEPGRVEPQPYVISSSPQYITVPPAQSVSYVPQPKPGRVEPQPYVISSSPQTRPVIVDNNLPYTITSGPQTVRPIIIENKQPFSVPPRPIIRDKEKVEKSEDYPDSSAMHSPFITREPRDKYKGKTPNREALAKAEQVALEEQNDKYEEKYKTVQCTRYARNFKTFLWALFIINLLLILVGFALVLLTLSHILFRDYISTVNRHTGFITWLWAVLVLALVIIVFGLFGVIVSINRSRRMLMMYCVLAAILALLILIFLLIFWVRVSALKALQNESIRKTFSLYRCQGWARNAWDDLQDKYECCGMDFRTDWKYIPPSCCQASSKDQKVMCVGHYITRDQAYKYGCRSMLEVYFLNIFLLITCLLILAIVLLILGILAAHRLMRMYKVIMLCRETYYIAS